MKIPVKYMEKMIQVIDRNKCPDKIKKLHIDPVAKRITVTEGHVLISIKSDDLLNFGKVPFTLEYEQIQHYIKLKSDMIIFTPNKDKVDVGLELQGVPLKETLSLDKREKDNYPSVEVLFPKTIRAIEQVQIDFKMLSLLLLPLDGIKTLKFEFYGEQRPVMLRHKEGDLEIEQLVMPVINER